MRAVRVILVVISALLIAAHFFRGGSYVLVAIALAIPALLLMRSTWGPRLAQALLAAAAAEWLRMLAMLVMERRAMGEPWIRLSLIIGAVAAFTVVSALMVRPKARGDR